MIYPRDEIEWLSISVWNVACDYWSALNLDDGRDWSELALRLATNSGNSLLVEQVKHESSWLLNVRFVMLTQSISRRCKFENIYHVLLIGV